MSGYKRCPRCGSTKLNGRRWTTSKLHPGAQPIDERGNYHFYSYVKTDEVMCMDCKLFEMSDDDSPTYDEFLQRWEDPSMKETFEQREASRREIERLREERERSMTWPLEPKIVWPRQWRVDRFEEGLRDFGPKYPENPELFAAVLANLDDNAPRWAYAEWMAQASEVKPESPPARIAWFIRSQLKVAESFRADPKAPVDSIFDQMLERGLAETTLDRSRGGLVSFYYNERLDLMRTCNLIAAPAYYRGFHEHVAMKAKFFLQFADELFSVAPIRYLTLTYCNGYMEQLAASPYLEQIRGIEFPHRMSDNKYTQLNNLHDDDVRAFLRSPHLRNLRVLEFEDPPWLTPRAFDAIAMSPNVPNLSYVCGNSWHWYVKDDDYHRTNLGRRMVEWGPELEARHGYLPWLHPEEHYGTLDPDREAAVCHPVGDASFRPDIAARRRPRLPPELIAALQERLRFLEHSLRETSLVATLTGPTPGRIVATLERAEPHPELNDCATLVRLTFQQTPPFPLWDHATQRSAVATPRSTVTLVVPHP